METLDLPGLIITTSWIGLWLSLPTEDLFYASGIDTTVMSTINMITKKDQLNPVGLV